MGYSFTERWKEELVYEEDGREYVFFCGWGADPHSVYVPVEAVWDEVTPDWLHGRRDEILARLREEGTHQIQDTDRGYAWPPPEPPAWLGDTEPPA